MLLRITGFSVASLAIGCGSALAQGAPAFSWSGFYGGLGVGYAQQSSTLRDSGLVNLFPAGSRDVTATGGGASLSAFVGYNFLVSPLLVLGIEADVATLPGRGKGSKVAFGGDFDVQQSSGTALSLRGRAGLALDRTLLFVSAGLATSDFQARGRWENVPDWKFDRKAGTGLVVGLGAEHALTDNLLIRVDGSFYNFGSGATSNQVTSPEYGFRGSQEAFTLRVGLAYKL